MPPQENLCISYARVSSGKQRREGFGIERQLERAQEYAARNNLTLDDRLSLQDAGRYCSSPLTRRHQPLAWTAATGCVLPLQNAYEVEAQKWWIK